MGNFKLEFEIRRVVFGLLAILKTPANCIPQLVQQQLPQITKQLGSLAHQVHKQRLKILEDNEKAVKNGFKDDSDDEDVEDEDDEGGDGENFFKKNMNKGMGLDDDDDDDDEDDSDYEEQCGEFSLYDSPLEEVDELICIKQTLD